MQKIIFQRLIIDENIIKIGFYKTVEKIKQDIIYKMLLKNWSIIKAKWHDQQFEAAKSSKKDSKFF